MVAIDVLQLRDYFTIQHGGYTRRSRRTPRQRTYQVDRNTKIIEIVFHYYQTPFKALISTYEGDPAQGGGGDTHHCKTSDKTRQAVKAGAHQV